jgi:hypothetical protein
MLLLVSNIGDDQLFKCALPFHMHTCSEEVPSGQHFRRIEQFLSDDQARNQIPGREVIATLCRLSVIKKGDFCVTLGDTEVVSLTLRNLPRKF